MKLKLNLNIKKEGKVFTKGSVIDVEADSNNIPLDRFWRRRLIDSRIDNCVEIIEKKETKNNNKKNK